GLHRTDELPGHRPGCAGLNHPSAARQAGPGFAGATGRGRRLHVSYFGVAGIPERGRPKGADDLVDQLGWLEGLDLRQQREVVAGPVTCGGPGIAPAPSVTPTSLVWRTVVPASPWPHRQVEAGHEI